MLQIPEMYLPSVLSFKHSFEVYLVAFSTQLILLFITFSAQSIFQFILIPKAFGVCNLLVGF